MVRGDHESRTEGCGFEGLVQVRSGGSVCSRDYQRGRARGDGVDSSGIVLGKLLVCKVGVSISRFDQRSVLVEDEIHDTMLYLHGFA